MLLYQFMLCTDVYSAAENSWKGNQICKSPYNYSVLATKMFYFVGIIIILPCQLDLHERRVETGVENEFFIESESARVLAMTLKTSDPHFKFILFGG